MSKSSMVAPLKKHLVEIDFLLQPTDYKSPAIQCFEICLHLPHMGLRDYILLINFNHLGVPCFALGNVFKHPDDPIFDHGLIYIMGKFLFLSHFDQSFLLLRTKTNTWCRNKCRYADENNGGNYKFYRIHDLINCELKMFQQEYAATLSFFQFFEKIYKIHSINKTYYILIFNTL